MFYCDVPYLLMTNLMGFHPLTWIAEYCNTHLWWVLIGKFQIYRVNHWRSLIQCDEHIFQMGGKKPLTRFFVSIFLNMGGRRNRGFVSGKWSDVFFVFRDAANCKKKRYVGNSLLVTMDLDGCFRLNRNVVLKEIANSTLQKTKMRYPLVN